MKAWQTVRTNCSWLNSKRLKKQTLINASLFLFFLWCHSNLSIISQTSALFLFKSNLLGQFPPHIMIMRFLPISQEYYIFTLSAHSAFTKYATAPFYDVSVHSSVFWGLQQTATDCESKTRTLIGYILRQNSWNWGWKRLNYTWYCKWLMFLIIKR